MLRRQTCIANSMIKVHVFPILWCCFGIVENDGQPIQTKKNLSQQNLIKMNKFVGEKY